MKQAIHFGAGNIGRGFIGELLVQSGYEVIFVDVNDELVNTINEKKAYNIKIVGDKPKTVHIEHVRAINSNTHLDALIAAICEADIITTAIGPNILKFIAPNIAKGLTERVRKNQTPLNIIACENMVGGSTVLRNFVYETLSDDAKTKVDGLIGFPDAAVDRIVPLQHNEEPLLVQVEPYSEWDVSRKTVKGEAPKIKGLTCVDDLQAYIERKLFTVNTGHASIAYLAYQKGIKDIYRAMQDKEILTFVRSVWRETGSMLIKKYGFDPKVHQQYVEMTEKRFANPYLSDEVTRVARGPIRKLGAKDRLVSPAVQLIEQGDEPQALAKVIAAALRFDFDGDKEACALRDFVKAEGYGKALAHFTGLAPDSKLYRLVMAELK